MHEAALISENEIRSLRASVDDAHHATTSERAAGALRQAETLREVSNLKMEMERRQAEALRREALLQKSRDELASSAAANERESAAALASARDEEVR